MASDYQKIKEENSKNPPINYRSIFTPYSDKTHFVYELIQNADDNKSQCIELQLYENGLLVWNDGNQFSEKDVRSICSIGFSNKDLTQIGTFGMGFKAVYTYTDIPEIYSGDERFRLPIKNPTIPEGIDIDEIDTRVVELLEKGRTVFWLPFRESMRLEIEIKRLRDCLSNLEKRSLLFLRNLRTVQWHDQNNGQKGIYSCQRGPYKKIQNASKIALKASVNGNDQLSEKFLVFRKEVQPPQEVIIELQQLSDDEDELRRIQRSSDKLQPVEVAFYLNDDEIKEMESCVLFAYLPTEIKTGLRFITQARYQTTLARDNIKKIEDSPWNRWLVQETADFLPEVLEQLKTGGLLKPTFFNVLPLKGEVENESEPITKALEKAMREHAFVPTEKGGYYARAEDVFYPDTPVLRKLVKSSGMYPESSLLHPDIRKGTKGFSRSFEIMHQAGVKEINIIKMLEWLEHQPLDWFKDRTNVWLRSLYDYLKGQKGQLRKIKKLPLIRLENGEQICAKDGLAFFPPDTDEDREEIAPFLKELPIVMSELLEGENAYEIEAFLKKLGVRKLNPDDIISEAILPQYLQSDKPSVAQNRLHVRYLFKVWDEISDTEIKKKVRETPFLYAYKEFQPDNSDFMVPCDAYLSQSYTGNTDLENYFSVYEGEICFVDDGYLEDDSNGKAWFQFFKEIGTMDTPQIIKKSIHVDYQNRQELANKYSLEWKRNTGKETIEDLHFDGLSEVLNQIQNDSNVDLSRRLWYLLVKALPLGKYARDSFFSGTYRWFYYNPRTESFDATFYRQLKDSAWLPDEKDNLYRPSECFAPTAENRNLLGDSVAYLHTDFDISKDKEIHQWLASELGVQLSADTDSVMNYLKTLSGSTANVKNIELLYRSLARNDARRREEFETNPLVFTPEPEPSWWQADKVFWEDESVVFGNDRGYLKKFYPENLKLFFHASGVSPHAAPIDYVRGIRDVTSTGNPGDEEVRNRVRILYNRLWPHLEEEGSFLKDEVSREEWEETREGECWLGKIGNEWGFFYSDELTWNDRNYFANIFKDEVPFWGFNDDLLEFAKYLNVRGCYESLDVEFEHYGEQRENPVWSKDVQHLYPYIQDFLHSPGFYEGHEEKKSAKVLKQLSVHQVHELEVWYKLKDISVPDPNPRQSFMEVTEQRAVLWIGLKEDEKEYPELIGDALQEYFGIDKLREFVKDVLSATDSYIDKTLKRWEQRGFQPNLCLSPPESDSKEGDKNAEESVDEKFQGGTGSEEDTGTNESDVETSAVPDESETENGNNDLKENEPITSTYQSRPSGITYSRGGNRSSTPSGNRGTGYRGGSGGGGEGEAHKDLKDYLADNPSELGQGLNLVKTEYRFKSGDEADILLEDSSGNPVTVEVKGLILSGSDQEAWQSVKYKHLAAVEYDLPCDRVRSILAAPEIPDDVKEKCKKLGIEPIEVPDLL